MTIWFGYLWCMLDTQSQGLFENQIRCRWLIGVSFQDVNIVFVQKFLDFFLVIPFAIMWHLMMWYQNADEIKKLLVGNTIKLQAKVYFIT